MKKLVWVAPAIILLTSCGISHFTSGGFAIKDNVICVGGTYGDILNSYTLTSSADGYKKPLLVSHDALKFPNMCFTVPVEIKYGYTYRLTYKINNAYKNDDVFLDKKDIRNRVK